MGMFDYIKFEIQCPNCGARVNDFQSKDWHCVLTELEYWEVNNFYSYCDECDAWIEFNRKKQKKQAPISDFKMTVRGGKE